MSYNSPIAFQKLEQITTSLHEANAENKKEPVKYDFLVTKINVYFADYESGLKSGKISLSKHDIQHLQDMQTELIKIQFAIQKNEPLFKEYARLLTKITSLKQLTAAPLTSRNIFEQPDDERISQIGRASHLARQTVIAPVKTEEMQLNLVTLATAAVSSSPTRATVKIESSDLYEEPLATIDQLKLKLGAEAHVSRPNLIADLDKKFMGMPINSVKAWITNKIRTNRHPRHLFRAVARKLGMPVNGQSKYEYASVMLQGLALYKANKQFIQDIMLGDMPHAQKEELIGVTLGFAYHANLNAPQMSVRMLEDFIETFESHYAEALEKSKTNPNAVFIFFDKFFNNNKVCLEDRYGHLGEYVRDNPLPETVDANAPPKEWDDEILVMYPEDEKTHKFNNIIGWELNGYNAAYRKHDPSAGPQWTPTGSQFKAYLESKKDIYNITAAGEVGSPKFTEDKLNQVIQEYVNDYLLEEDDQFHAE